MGRVRVGILMLVTGLAAGLAMTACGPGSATALTGSGNAPHSPDPNRPGYQRYQDGGQVSGRITGLHLSGEMRLTVRAGNTASVHRTVEYKDTDPGTGTWGRSGNTVDLNGCPVSNCLISYDVVVPAGTALTGEVDSGGADIRGIASVDLTANSDTVGIQQISGAVALKAASTTSTLSDITGAVDATANSGEFTARNVRGALTLHSSSSKVTAQGIGGSATLELQSAQAMLGMAGAQNVSLSVTSGSVTITVPRADYHVTSTQNSAELNSTVQDNPAGRHQIALTMSSAQVNLDYA